MTYFQKAAENAIRGETIDLVPTPRRGSVTERMRRIADGPHPWIPGAEVAFIREIADTLEQQETQIKNLEAALLAAGVAPEIVAHIKEG